MYISYYTFTVFHPCFGTEYSTVVLCSYFPANHDKSLLSTAVEAVLFTDVSADVIALLLLLKPLLLLE